MRYNSGGYLFRGEVDAVPESPTAGQYGRFTEIRERVSAMTNGGWLRVQFRTKRDAIRCQSALYKSIPYPFTVKVRGCEVYVQKRVED